MADTTYRFPRTKWDECDDYDALSEQVHVVAEEAGECAKALRKESPERLAYEAWDTIQASEGVLRRLANNGIDIEAMRQEVEDHCRAHGYYDLNPERIAIEADCAACINTKIDFSPTCNGNPCPHWTGGGRTYASDDELPGMWKRADFEGGATDV